MVALWDDLQTAFSKQEEVKTGNFLYQLFRIPLINDYKIIPFLNEMKTKMKEKEGARLSFDGLKRIEYLKCWYKERLLFLQKELHVTVILYN